MYLFVNDIWYMVFCLSVCLIFFGCLWREIFFYFNFFFEGGVDLKGFCIVYDKLYGSVLLLIKVNWN